jgi:hypothetical protein
VTARGLVTICALSVAVLHAQQGSPRDVEVKPTVGNAQISGVVITDETEPHPVRRAIVTLSGAGLRPNRGAITDDDGRFALEQLPAGVFTLTVSRASFITSVYGAKRPGRPGTAIAVGDGQKVEGLTVRMWRGAAIGGVIKDEAGTPVPGISVNVIPARAGGSGLLTLSNNGATTDDRGEFRIFGLEPGTYLVSARPPVSGSGPLVAFSEADVDALLIAARRGLSAPAVPSGTAPPPQASSKPFDYAPVFYPGTSAMSDATQVTLAAGQEVTGVDFALQRVSTSVVEGVVTRPDGSPAAQASVQLTAVSPQGPFASVPLAVINATTGPDGLFRMAQVTPGDYRLVVKGALSTTPPADARVVTPGNREPALWAQTDLGVTGTDIRGLALRLEPGMPITGKVIFDGATPPPADLSKIQVWFKPPNLPTRPGASINSINMVSPALVRADGTFEILNVIPGPYLPSVTLSGADAATWWPKSAVMGDRDLLDGRVDITRGTAGSLIVTLSDRRSELQGTLQTAAGARASDVFVIAYSVDRRFWLPAARRVQAVRPDASGRYVIANLPAGDYLVAAVTDVDQDEWFDPAFLEKLVEASAKVTIAEGERKTFDLRLGGGW